MSATARSTEIETSAAAYTSGDTVGSVKTLSDVALSTKECTLLQTLVVIDKANQKKAIDILFFDTAPTVGADNEANALSSADLANSVGRISVVAADYATHNSNAEATLRGVGLEMQCAGKKTDLYMVVIAKDTPTYGAGTTQLIVKTAFIQE